MIRSKSSPLSKKFLLTTSLKTSRKDSLVWSVPLAITEPEAKQSYACLFKRGHGHRIIETRVSLKVTEQLLGRWAENPFPSVLEGKNNRFLLVQGSLEFPKICHPGYRIVRHYRKDAKHPTRHKHSVDLPKSWRVSKPVEALRGNHNIHTWIREACKHKTIHSPLTKKLAGHYHVWHY